MRTTIFAYRGYVGIDSDPSADHLVAGPHTGSIGCVVESEGIDISPEALEELKKIKKSGDDLGEVDVFKSGDKVVVGWLGGYRKVFKAEDIEGSSEFDASLLTANPNVVVPDEFKEAADEWLAEQESQ